MSTIIDRLRRFLVRLRERIRILRQRSQIPTETFTLLIGIVEGTEDARRPVRFEGRVLASRTYSQDNERILEILYKSEDRLLVYTQTLRRTIGLRTECELRELSEPELETEFPRLSQLSFPLGLKEALSQ